MSALEQRARATLAPMILDRPTLLDHEAQLLVATWAIKTALVFDAKYPDRRIMTAEQVVRFGSDRAPIEGSQVYLARYAAGDWVLNRTRSGVVLSSDDGINGGEPSVLVTALSVGSLILLVVAPTRPEYVADANRLTQSDAPFTLTIFPTDREARTWPPAVAVPSEKFVQLVNVNY